MMNAAIFGFCFGWLVSYRTLALAGISAGAHQEAHLRLATR